MAVKLEENNGSVADDLENACQSVRYRKVAAGESGSGHVRVPHVWAGSLRSFTTSASQSWWNAPVFMASEEPNDGA